MKTLWRAVVSLVVVAGVVVVCFCVVAVAVAVAVTVVTAVVVMRRRRRRGDFACCRGQTSRRHKDAGLRTSWIIDNGTCIQNIPFGKIIIVKNVLQFVDEMFSGNPISANVTQNTNRCLTLT